MRIILFVNSFPTLSETFISNKVKRLSAAGFHVTVFCVQKNKKLYETLFADNKNVHIVELRKASIVPFLLLHPLIVIKSLFKPGNYRQRLFRKYRLALIKKHKPDIVHFEFSGIGVDYLYEIKRLDCKKVISCRGSAEKVKLLYKERQKGFKELLDAIDAIHCVSDDMRKTILPFCDDPHKIFVNYPSIDTAFFSRRSKNTSGNAVCTILSIGRFTFQKGFGTGLQAAHVLKQRNIPFKWIIVGTGPEYEQLLFQLHYFGLENEVELAGSKTIHEVQSLMEQADIYFLPSIYEGIANVALEAMSMELPIVATRSGGMEEVIVNGENGLLTDVYDDEGMAAALAKLIAGKELRSKLGSNARKTIEQKFNLDIQTQKYIEVYSALAKTDISLKPSVNNNDNKKITTDSVSSASSEAKPKLTIGIILPEFPSVSETFFINKVVGLCRRGHTVIVFDSSRPTDPGIYKTYQLDQYKNLIIKHLDFKRSPLLLLKTFLAFPLVFIKSFHIYPTFFRRALHINLCKAYTNRYACDVYHFGYSGTAIFYLSLFNSLKGKKLISCRGTAENVKLVSEKDRITKLQTVFQKTDRIHCVSESMSATIQSYGAPLNKIFINRPAVDTTFFTRNSAYVSKNKIVIISVGRLVFQKGFMIGILAIAALQKKFSNFVWKIVGDGPEMEELMSHVHSLGLVQHVQLLGKKNKHEIKELYEEADIYFLPSVSEGLANAVLEAMSMSMPVVSSDVGGMGEAIENNINGKLCSNYEQQQMTDALYELCINFEERKRLGEAARIKAVDEFDLKRYIDVFEQEYYQLLQ